MGGGERQQGELAHGGRIHTPSDDLARLEGRGVEEVAARLAALLARPGVGIDAGGR